jgi:hypothetical protein
LRRCRGIGLFALKAVHIIDRALQFMSEWACPDMRFAAHPKIHAGWPARPIR